MQAMPAKQVNHLIAGNRMYPGSQGLAHVIGMPLIVDSQKHFLDHVLNLVRKMRETSPEIGAQMRTEFVEKKW